MNESRLSDMDKTVDHGSSYESVYDIRRESTFGRNTDDDTRDICTFCLNIGDKKHYADYFCQDCGPFGRFLCSQCMKYHKLFKKEHVSVKSFAVANYDNRLVPLIQSLQLKFDLSLHPNIYLVRITTLLKRAKRGFIQNYNYCLF